MLTCHIIDKALTGFLMMTQHLANAASHLGTVAGRRQSSDTRQAPTQPQATHTKSGPRMLCAVRKAKLQFALAVGCRQKHSLWLLKSSTHARSGRVSVCGGGFGPCKGKTPPQPSTAQLPFDNEGQELPALTPGRSCGRFTV